MYNTGSLSKASTLALLASIIIVGFYAIIMQSLFLREILVISFGNELCFGLILGFWLLGISTGAYSGGRVSEKVHDTLFLFFIMTITLLFLFPLLIYLIRISRLIYGIPSGEYMTFSKLLLFALSSVAPASFLIGFTFPLICKARIGEEILGDRIATVYVFEAFGSILGGLIFTFLMVPFFSTFETISLCNMVVMSILLVPSMILFRDRKKLITSCMLSIIIIGFILAFSSGVFERLDRYAVKKRWASFSKHIELLESKDSKYQNIAIGRTKEQYSVFLNGQYSSSFPDEYHHAVMANFIMTEHHDPKKILLIGEGLSGLIKNILKYPIERLDYLELDYKMVETIKKFLPEEDRKALKDERLSIYSEDGKYYLRRRSEKYDLIILNLPNPTSAMLNRFYTVDFFGDAKTSLKEDGMLVTSLRSQINYLGEETIHYSGSVYKALSNVFKRVLITPGENEIFFASDSEKGPTFDIETLSKRYKDRGIESEYFTEFHFQLLLPQDRVEFIEKKIKGAEGLPLNTDIRPVTYFYSLLLWDRFSNWSRISGSKFGDAIEFLNKLNFFWFLLPIILFWALRSGFIIFKKRGLKYHKRFNSSLSMFVTGFSGMAFSLILIFSFQNIFGYVYQKIGLIVAIFMFGLAMGGYTMKVLIGYGYNEERLILTNQILIFLYSLTLTELLFIFSSEELTNLKVTELLFQGVLFLGGLLTGFQFPLAGKIYLNTGAEIGRTAGIIDGADHLGAFLGAIITGVILIPILGMARSCYLIAVFNIVPVFFWLVTLGQEKGGKRSDT